MIKHLCKPAIALLLIMAASVTAKAQIKRPHLLLGANIFYANPKGEFGNANHFGIGGELTGGIGFNKTYLLATIGNSVYFADSKNVYGNTMVKPVKLGVKHYVLANKIFVSGDVGIATAKDKMMDASEKRFIRSIGAGLHFLGLEAGLYYDGWKSLHANGYSNSVLVKVGWNKMF